jgi:excisionase family DNA binding protein
MKSNDTAPARERAADRNFSIAETAEWSGVSKPTVWRAIAAGELDAIKIGRRALTTPEGRARWKASWPSARTAA